MPSAPTPLAPRPTGFRARLTALVAAALVAAALVAAALVAAALVAAALAGLASPAPADASPHGLGSTREAGPDLSFVPGTASPAELDEVEALVGATYASLAEVWAPVFGRPTVVGIRLVRPGAAVEFSACNRDVPVNLPLTAFYCPADDTIWLNDLLLVGFARRFGPFAVATVVAHEYAHKLQRDAGVFGVARPIVDVELQADCLAGAWSRSRALAGLLSEADVAAAAAAVAAVGDTELTDRNHHGTPDQRQAAWHRGLAGHECPIGAS
jgi:predicted metalloprotease